MADRDLTAREDRFIGLCLAAVAIIIVFIFIVCDLAVLTIEAADY